MRATNCSYEPRKLFTAKDAKETNAKMNPDAIHQIGDLDDKACTLFSFAFLASFAVNSFLGS